MSWPTVKLSEICSVLSGFVFKSNYFGDSGIPLVRIRDVMRGFSETYYSGEYDEQFVVNNNDILIGMDGDFNIAKWAGGEALLNQRVCKITPDLSIVDADYLFYFLPLKLKEIWDETAFVTVKHLSVKKINDIDIPLPELSIQKDISAMLRVSDSLRNQSKKMESELNALAQAVFVDMFGDPLINSKGWDKKKLKDLGELNRGKSKHRPRNDPKLLGGSYPLIQTGDVARADNYIVHYNSTYSELGLKQSKLWPKGTLCITIAANIADTAILSFDACFPDSVVGFNANTNLTSNEFIHYWLKFYQSTLEQLAPESAQKNINLKILEEIDIFVPPLIHQLEFVAILNAIEGRKKDARRQNECLYKCFSALMQRAFSRKLDLKKVA
ncbi:restriction endonuclease subunit S [Pectobacterium brasiliense]|uniref:restriction endonuclease subunit S n=1 Tax=Pectobacterium brasiliense TaxID=180957 RepID=UPI003873BE80